MNSVDVIIAALVGGIMGFVASYFGPIGREKWKQKQIDEKYDNPRKELLEKALKMKEWKMRSLDILRRYTGTTEEECRRLLIEINARGGTLKSGKEAWGLISENPIDQQDVSEGGE